MFVTFFDQNFKTLLLASGFYTERFIKEQIVRIINDKEVLLFTGPIIVMTCN